MCTFRNDKLGECSCDRSGALCEMPHDFEWAVSSFTDPHPLGYGRLGDSLLCKGPVE